MECQVIIQSVHRLKHASNDAIWFKRHFSENSSSVLNWLEFAVLSLMHREEAHIQSDADTFGNRKIDHQCQKLINNVKKLSCELNWLEFAVLSLMHYKEA